MFKAEKVLWGEGLFLRPQHFQLQDAYHEQRLNQMIQATFPFAYGIQAIEFDEAQFSMNIMHSAELKWSGKMGKFIVHLHRIYYLSPCNLTV